MAPPLTGFVDFSDLASARHCPEQPERRTVLQNGREKLFHSTGRPDGNQTRAICFPTLGKTSRPQPIDQIDMVRLDIYAIRYKMQASSLQAPRRRRRYIPNHWREITRLDRQVR